MKEYQWLEELLLATADSESPLRFKLWASLFAVGVATRRRISLRMKGILDLYPNLYILLIAESGLGKQFPITMASKLLRESGVARVISGRNSIEAIIETLGKATTLETGTMIKNAEAGLVSGEFANILIENPSALTILTQLYDTESLETWDNTLRRGQDKLRNVYLSLLAATNLEHFNDRVQAKDIQGGFIARTMCIYETKVSHLDSLMGEGEAINFKQFSNRLVEISKLSGTMKMEKAAQVLYDEWYYPFYRNLRSDKTGFIRRLRIHILKVAMCLSLIERDDLIITARHIQDAMDLCIPVMDDITTVSKQSGKSKYRSNYALIIQELIKAPEHMMRRRILLNKNLGEFNTRELGETLETLIQGGYIESVSIDDEQGYKLTVRCIEELEKPEDGK